MAEAKRGKDHEVVIVGFKATLRSFLEFKLQRPWSVAF